MFTVLVLSLQTCNNDKAIAPSLHVAEQRQKLTGESCCWNLVILDFQLYTLSVQDGVVDTEWIAAWGKVAAKRRNNWAAVSSKFYQQAKNLQLHFRKAHGKSAVHIVHIIHFTLVLSLQTCNDDKSNSWDVNLFLYSYTKQDNLCALPSCTHQYFLMHNPYRHHHAP